jgi:uncharacterized RDD family membrane protein YckC
MIYAGFWRRFGAYWIDVLVMIPLIGLAYFCGEKSRLFQLYWFIPGLLIGIGFHVYLVKRFGGTPGKLLLNMRIAMLDGSPVTLKAASLRYSVLFILSFLSSLALLLSVLSMTDELYFSLGYIERSQKTLELAPSWYRLVSILLQVWIWSEFISMLFNKQRRAIHDFIAGTVVVHEIKSA